MGEWKHLCVRYRRLNALRKLCIDITYTIPKCRHYEVSEQADKQSIQELCLSIMARCAKQTLCSPVNLAKPPIVSGRGNFLRQAGSWILIILDMVSNTILNEEVVVTQSWLFPGVQRQYVVSRERTLAYELCNLTGRLGRRTCYSEYESLTYRYAGKFNQ